MDRSLDTSVGLKASAKKDEGSLPQTGPFFAGMKKANEQQAIPLLIDLMSARGQSGGVCHHLFSHPHLLSPPSIAHVAQAGSFPTGDSMRGRRGRQRARAAWTGMALWALRLSRARLRLKILILARAMGDWFRLARKMLRYHRDALRRAEQHWSVGD